jgi:hypothetical protein
MEGLRNANYAGRFDLRVGAIMRAVAKPIPEFPFSLNTHLLATEALLTAPLASH